jgi:hypothetical protein
MCFTYCNPIPTGRKQVAQSPDAEDTELAQPPALDKDKDKDKDPLASVKPPKKRQKKGMFMLSSYHANLLKKMIVAPLPNADSVNAEGFLTDIEVTGINKPSKPRREQRNRDIDALFSVPYLKDGKKYRDCHACR